MHGPRWFAASAVVLVTISGWGNGPEPALGQDVGPPVDDLPPGLLDGLAEQAAAALPAVADRISAADAELVGRQAIPGIPGPGPVPGVDGRVGERVLGAVGPVLDVLSLDAPAELVPIVAAPRLPDGGYAVFQLVGADPTTEAVGRLRQFGPQVIPWATAITAALAGHPRLAPALRVGDGTEAEIVAAHSRAHLALALVVSATVVPAAQVQLVGSEPAAVVGAAVEAAGQVLRARPLPDSHAAALLERRRAEYEIPNHVFGDVALDGHRFGLLEGPLPAGSPDPADGLVTVVPGGLVVRTGVDRGSVRVDVRVLAGPPDDDARDLAAWQEIVEVGFTAQAGGAAVVSDAGPAPGRFAESTPPWPGPWRARVAARGRDDGDGERYEIAVWSAPPAPGVVLRATDRLGHRLRGEPEPPVVERPERAYRWLEGSSLGEAATVTVVTGSSVEQVIEAFGADPARPWALDDDLIDPFDSTWVSVLPVDGAVVAVEWNGWQGSTERVLAAASERGRAASMYWNVNALTNLAFARGGEVVDSYEPLFEHEAVDPEVLAALDGIDWFDYSDLHAKGLVAVEKWTGHGVRAEDVERMESAYLIPDAG